ncbi:MAG: aryl-sulfate sulfotransferase [Deltaproteobacteria bacterium]|nr:aryl-sulfate sulfotransferase [Deltaproteobacteria bacterium]
MSRTDRTAASLALLLAACKGDDIEISEVEAVVSDDVATVVIVTWRTDVPTRGHVLFGVEGEGERATADTPEGTEHRAVLVGLPANAAISGEVVSGDSTAPLPPLETGSLPDDIPTTSFEGEPGDDFALTSATVAGSEEIASNWVLLTDPAGRVVWYHRDDRGLSIFRARASVDGAGVVYASVLENGGPSENSELVRVSWDGSTESAVAVPNLAHDFVEREDGVVVSLGYVFRDDIEGNDLVEIRADGSTESLWTTWDCFDPVENAGDDPAHGWTHANALDYDLASGDYLVGLRNLATIARVDTATRTCPWGFGGTGGTVDIEGTRFIHQHGFELAGDRMLVFDNDGGAGNVSRGIEYAFDEDALTATEERVLVADPPLYSFIMGDIHRLDDGGTVLLWSVPQLIDRLDAEGVRVGRLSIEGGAALGFVELIRDPGR